LHRILRQSLVFMALLGTLALAACGGDSGGKNAASSSSDVNTLLK
jgi:hypothetical protein